MAGIVTCRSEKKYSPYFTLLLIHVLVTFERTHVQKCFKVQKGVIRSQKPKNDMQCNVQKRYKKRRQNDNGGQKTSHRKLKIRAGDFLFCLEGGGGGGRGCVLMIPLTESPLAVFMDADGT
jgi:hypothetical protein